jgi:hypothetical protein
MVEGMDIEQPAREVEASARVSRLSGLRGIGPIVPYMLELKPRLVGCGFCNHSGGA